MIANCRQWEYSVEVSRTQRDSKFPSMDATWYISLLWNLFFPHSANLGGEGIKLCDIRWSKHYATPATGRHTWMALSSPTVLWVSHFGPVLFNKVEMIVSVASTLLMLLIIPCLGCTFHSCSHLKFVAQTGFFRTITDHWAESSRTMNFYPSNPRRAFGRQKGVWEPLHYKYHLPDRMSKIRP